MTHLHTIYVVLIRIIYNSDIALTCQAAVKEIVNYMNCIANEFCFTITILCNALAKRHNHTFESILLKCVLTYSIANLSNEHYLIVKAKPILCII